MSRERFTFTFTYYTQDENRKERKGTHCDGGVVVVVVSEAPSTVVSYWIGDVP
jgi:hypothetical protein